jgi:hypothetical protein
MDTGSFGTILLNSKFVRSTWFDLFVRKISYVRNGSRSADILL